MGPDPFFVESNLGMAGGRSDNWATTKPMKIQRRELVYEPPIIYKLPEKGRFGKLLFCT